MIGRNSQFLQYVDGLFLLMLSFRVMKSFSIFAYMDWLVTVLSRAFKRLVVFYILLCPYFICMNFILFFVSGANVDENSSMNKALITNIRYALGVGNTANYFPIS